MATKNYGAMTELESVNEMLRNIGYAPTQSLETAGDSSVSKAVSILHSVSREVQERGWHFNTEHNRKLVPDTSGNIILPSNTLRVDTVGCSSAIRVVQEGTRLRLVDVPASSSVYTFTSSVYVDLYLFLKYEALPQAARWYITVRAARRLGNATQQSGTIYQFTHEDEVSALFIVSEYEADAGDFNMLTGTYLAYRSGLREGL